MPSVSKLNKVKQVQHDNTKTWRLKDAKPKANSRGLLSPWKQRRRIENGVCKDAERQRIRGLKATKPTQPPVHRHPELVSGSVSGERQEKARGEMLKFAIEREQSQACLNYAEPTNETRAEDACILCLVRRRKTKST